MIEYKEMVRKLAKPGQDIIDDLTPGAAHNLHMAIGINGEVAEFLEAIRDGDDNVIEELGDIEFYFEGLQQGVDFEIDLRHTDLTFVDWNLRSLTESLAIEAGNILDCVKKQAIYNKQLDMYRLIHLMLDFRAILNSIYKNKMINTTHAIVKSDNIQKLGERYEGFKYSNESAQKRADKVL